MTDMPSAINRMKTNNLLVKVDKENENKDIKRKQKTGTGAKEKTVTIGPTETVWNRLSRVKKVPSNDCNIELPSTSRTALIKTNQRVSTRLLCPKKPLSPTFNSNRASSLAAAAAVGAGERPKRILKVPKATLECVEVDVLASDKIVTEIMTARSMCDSKSSSGSSKNSAKRTTPYHSNPGSGRTRSVSQEYDNNEITDSKESLGDYKIAPLIPVPTNDSMDNSAIISTQFCTMLRGKKRSMAPEEISIIKDVIKTDGRHRHLEHNNSKLFKDILKTQLHEILRQGSVVKTALTNLDATSDEASMTAFLADTPLESPPPSTDPQVDVIFKNVPTLEKEIIILKALGEKLEATLKRTSHREPQITTYVQKLPLPSSIAYFYCFMIKLGYAEGSTKCVGVCKQIGVVREFQIVQKSIIELKECIHDHFYLPTHNNSAELKCTTFKRLKRNPEVLMRHLKPKKALMPFNVLEQDPMFFNNYINPPVRVEPSKTSLWSKHDSTSSLLVNGSVGREAGDFSYKLPLSLGYRQQTGCFQAARCRWRAILYHSVFIDAELYATQTPPSVGLKLEKGYLKVSSLADSKKQHRRNKHKEEKPVLDAGRPLTPRNSLALTIIVGGLQVILFVLLIMAFTYPDFKC